MLEIINKREKTLKRKCQGEFKFVEYEVIDTCCAKHQYIFISDEYIFHTDKSMIDKLIEDEESDMFLDEKDWENVKEVTL